MRRRAMASVEKTESKAQRRRATDLLLGDVPGILGDLEREPSAPSLAATLSVEKEQQQRARTSSSRLIPTARPPRWRRIAQRPHFRHRPPAG